MTTPTKNIRDGTTSAIPKAPPASTPHAPQRSPLPREFLAAESSSSRGHRSMGSLSVIQQEDLPDVVNLPHRHTRVSGVVSCAMQSSLIPQLQTPSETAVVQAPGEEAKISVSTSASGERMKVTQPSPSAPAIPRTSITSHVPSAAGSAPSYAVRTSTILPPRERMRAASIESQRTGHRSRGVVAPSSYASTTSAKIKAELWHSPTTPTKARHVTKVQSLYSPTTPTKARHVSPSTPPRKPSGKVRADPGFPSSPSSPSSPSRGGSSSSGTTVAYRTARDGSVMSKPEPMDTDEESALLHSGTEPLDSDADPFIVRPKVESPSSEEESAVLRAIGSSSSDPQTAPQSPREEVDDVPTPKPLPPYTSKGPRRSGATGANPPPVARERPSSGPSSPKPRDSVTDRDRPGSEVSVQSTSCRTSQLLTYML